MTTYVCSGNLEPTKCNWFLIAYICLSLLVWLQMKWASRELRLAWIIFDSNSIFRIYMCTSNFISQSDKLKRRSIFYYLYIFAWKKKNEMNPLFYWSSIFAAEPFIWSEKFKVCVYNVSKKKRIWCSYFVYHIQLTSYINEKALYRFASALYNIYVVLCSVV